MTILVCSSEMLMPNLQWSDSMKMELLLLAISLLEVKSNFTSLCMDLLKMLFHNITVLLVDQHSHLSGQWVGNKLHGNTLLKILPRLHLKDILMLICLLTLFILISLIWTTSQTSQSILKPSLTSEILLKISKLTTKSSLSLSMLQFLLKIQLTSTILKEILIKLLFNQVSIKAINTVKIWFKKFGQKLLYSLTGYTIKLATLGTWVYLIYSSKFHMMVSG